MIYIAGIGSRKTPIEICIEMTKIGEWCRKNGIMINSGHAEGADEAFELGAQENCVAYIPWASFNFALKTKATKVISPGNDPKASDLAAKYHPGYTKLTAGARKLIERDGYQVLGQNLDSPVKAIVCWTEGAKLIGGTGQALRIAKGYNIVVFNMALSAYNSFDKVIKALMILK